MKTAVTKFQYLETDSLQAVKAGFYAHFEYLDHKTYLDAAWNLFVSDRERYDTFATGGWVDLAGTDCKISLERESGAIVWNYTDESLDEQWARTIEFDAGREGLLMCTEECDGGAENEMRERVKTALRGDAMIRVQAIENLNGQGFAITLRRKDSEKSQLKFYSYRNYGGLATEVGIAILRAYEFSMQRYIGQGDTRAATEYVRRKLRKMVG